MRLAEAEGLYFAPSFHRDLVLGVATWALELFEAAPGLEVLYVPIGMGSGICGAILARDLLGLKTEIVGVQSEGAPSYKLSYEAGRVIETNSAMTNADGLATRVPEPRSAGDHPQRRLPHRHRYGRGNRRGGARSIGPTPTIWRKARAPPRSPV